MVQNIPICDSATSVFLRSHSGEYGSPSSNSRSPCARKEKVQLVWRAWQACFVVTWAWARNSHLRTEDENQRSDKSCAVLQSYEPADFAQRKLGARKIRDSCAGNNNSNLLSGKAWKKPDILSSPDPFEWLPRQENRNKQFRCGKYQRAREESFVSHSFLRISHKENWEPA